MQETLNKSKFKLIDFYLADDILQGENIPFYLLWEGEDPLEINISFEGFTSLIELHNSAIKEAIFKENKVIVNSFQIGGYLGGILSTEISENYDLISKLKLEIINKDGIRIPFEQKRVLYGTTISIPDLHELSFLTDPITENSQKIELLLHGKTTIFFSIEELEDNECGIDVPLDVKEELERLTNLFDKGLKDLGKRFPAHSDLLNLMINFPDEKLSISAYLEELEDKMRIALKDKIFAEAFISLLLISLFHENSLEEVIIKPLHEYFETYSKQKAYFSNPLLCVDLQHGSHQLAIKLLTTNLIDQESGDPLEIRTMIHSDKEMSIPIRNLFELRREE
jgi:hypothetical protein